MMFDVTVAAPWPKGVYLCLRLREQGLKVCYVETAPEKGPLALFLDESEEEEMAFYLRLFSLEKLDGGLSIVGGGGVWGLQRPAPPSAAKACQKARSHDTSGAFQDAWLSFFALNGATGRLFGHNNSLLGLEPLPLFEDCFLIKPSAAKKQRFLAEEAGFAWINGGINGGINGAQNPLKIERGRVSLSREAHQTRKALFLHQPKFEVLRPDFVWTPLVFECNLRAGYDEIVPPHFILIDRLRAPWTLGNMLSVFKERGGRWRAWIRAPFHAQSRVMKALVHHAGKNLSKLFKAPVQFLRAEEAGFAVYGKSALRFLQKNRPLFVRFPEGLGALQLRGEKQLLKQTLKELSKALGKGRIGKMRKSQNSKH